MTEAKNVLSKIETERFGEVNYKDEDVLIFPRGLPAFEDNRRWILVGEEDNAVKWLQSLDDGELAMPVTTPDAVRPDYNARIPEDELHLVGSLDHNDLVLLIVLSIPNGAPWDMSANLRAPILLNLKTHKAVQIIALNEEYPVRHIVFPENVREEMKRRAQLQTQKEEKE